MKKTLLLMFGIALASQAFAQERRCIEKDGEYVWTELSFCRYEYDSAGNLSHTKETNGSEKWFDAAGNVIHSIDKEGFETISEYDSRGNLARYISDEGTDETYEYEYNSKNQIVKRTAFSEILELYTVVKSTSNLKLRTGEERSSEVIGIIPEGTQVMLLETGKAEVIDGINSPWMKVGVMGDVKTEGGNLVDCPEGWCFGGYLTGKGHRIE